MKKLIFISLLLQLFFGAFAQDKFGIFGHFSVGYGWEDWSQVSDDLRIPERLGTDLNLTNHGVSGGAAGYLVFDRFLLGFKGYGTAFGTHSTPRGKVEMVSGMGFLEIGTLLYAKPGSFGYVFAGIGGGGAGVFFTNHSGEDWFFEGSSPQSGVHVYPDMKKDFGYGGAAGEIGLALDRWVIGRNGGLKIGLESGVNLWLHRVEWENEDVEINDLSHPGNVGFYLRLTVGGGYVGSRNSTGIK